MTTMDSDSHSGDEMTRPPYGSAGASLALLVLTVMPLPSPVRLSAAIVACGVWLAAEAGQVDGLRLGVPSLGTRFFGWGMACVAVAAATAIGRSGLGDGYLGLFAGLIVFVGTIAMWLLIAVAVLTAAMVGLEFALRGRTMASQ